ncbi:MAG TPA: endonuclease/exonuclease/phosphatase family protein [Ferruginibacter sp.]|nr:endonuclease/exonuclease/phosphatase family protein [Ferruginibacter sp.]HRE64168.1 endonuclease/exonuclease/phosphatase family protein [Ferruginibacter sp.]
MKHTIKKWALHALMAGNIFFIIAALLAMLAAYVNPAKWWPVAIAAIGFPISIVILVCFALLWLFINRKKAIYSAITILLCIPGILKVFAMHPFANFQETKNENHLRVLSWNTGLMNYSTLDTNLAIKYNQQIFDKIKSANADVVCLQEFFSATKPGNHYNLMDSLSRTLGYPYYYFSRDVPKIDGSFFNGVIIYSRYPIVDSNKTKFPFSGLYAGSVIKTGIAYKNDTIDIVSTRLQLMRFSANEYKELYEMKHFTSQAYANSKSLVGKIRRGYYFLSQQADIVKNVLSESKRPVLFNGDLNDIPLSYTYGTIKGSMNDAWANAGWGIGKTYQAISPTLRVDQIFYDNHFSIQQIKRIIAQDETDHNGLLADFILKK